MFFRGRQPEASIWRRFRVSADGFTFAEEDDHFTAHVVANAERVVDLFYTLSEQLPPAIEGLCPGYGMLYWQFDLDRLKFILISSLSF